MQTGELTQGLRTYCIFNLKNVYFPTILNTSQFQNKFDIKIFIDPKYL